MKQGRRVIRSEFLRGAAPVALVAVLGVSLGLLFGRTTFMSPWPWAWVGRWGALANSTRVILAILIPIAVATAAWQGGRDHRRRVGELIESTSRPSWHRTAASWGAVTLAVCGGLIITLLVSAAFVVPHATIIGGGWWWTLAVGFVALAASTAAGFAAGKMIPFRYVAPIAGVTSMVLLETFQNPGVPDQWSWLSPAFIGWWAQTETFRLEPSLLLEQTLWIGGAGLALLILAGARRKWLAVVPAAVGVLGISLILGGGGKERYELDPVAAELVCVGTRVDVCLDRANSFLLDDLTPVVEEHLLRWEGVNGVDVERIGEPRPTLDLELPDESGTVPVSVGPGQIGWNGRLKNPDRWGNTIEQQVASGVAWNRACDDLADELFREEIARHEASGGAPEVYVDYPDPTLGTLPIVVGWAIQEPTFGSPVYDEQRGVFIDPEPNPLTVRLLSWPEAEQKAWVGRYMAAKHTCDRDVFAELVEELG